MSNKVVPVLTSETAPPPDGSEVCPAKEVGAPNEEAAASAAAPAAPAAEASGGVEEEVEVDVEDNVFLGWRRECLADLPTEEELEHAGGAEVVGHGMVEGSEQEGGSLEARVEALVKKGCNMLTSDAYRNMKVAVPGRAEEVDLMASFMDLSCFAKNMDFDFRPMFHWVLQRCKLVNSVGGPRQLCVHWSSIKRLGRIPRWPDDAAHILDYERVLEAWVERMDEFGKIGDRAICCSMLSHRWERPAPPNAHPDSEDGKKAAALARYGEKGSCPMTGRHEWDYFYWIDFSCVHQTSVVPKALGIAKLPLYVSLCVEVLVYFSDSAAYEPRAWTRAERVIAYMAVANPMLVYMDDQYAAGEQLADVDELAARHSGYLRKDEEIGCLMMRMGDPLAEDANITNPADKVALEALLASVCGAAPLSPYTKLPGPAPTPAPAPAEGGAEGDGEAPQKGGRGEEPLDDKTRRALAVRRDLEAGVLEVAIDTMHYDMDANGGEGLKQALDVNLSLHHKIHARTMVALMASMQPQQQPEPEPAPEPAPEGAGEGEPQEGSTSG